MSLKNEQIKTLINHASLLKKIQVKWYYQSLFKQLEPKN